MRKNEAATVIIVAVILGIGMITLFQFLPDSGLARLVVLLVIAAVLTVLTK